MIKILYVHGYKGDKYGPSFQSLAKYADAANFAGEKVEMLYNLTRHMYERTDMLNDFIKSMPLHEEDDDIMVNAYLRLWDDAGSSVLEFDDDDFYGSYFAGMIDLLLMMDSDYIHIEDIMSRTHIEDRVLIIDDRVRNRIMDDGQSWNDGVLKNPKFSHLVICHADHKIWAHNNVSIPARLRS